MSQIDTSTWLNPLPGSVSQDFHIIFGSLSSWLATNAGGASASVLTTAAGSTLPANTDSTLTVSIPSGVVSVAVVVSGATTASANWVVLRHKLGSPTQIDPPVYTAASTSATPVNFDPAVFNVLPGQSSTLVITNQSSVAVSATVTVLGFTVPAGVVQSKRQLVERWAWLGWECSNMNGSGTTVPTNVNFKVPISAPMRLRGVNVDFSVAIASNPSSTTHLSALAVGGFYRASTGAPYAIGSNAANPTGAAAPGFGTLAADTNCTVGPTASPFANTFFATGIQASDANTVDGVNKHVDVDCDILLDAGDGLWFHMSGATTPGSTTATVDGEMQLALRYVLL